MQPAKIRLVVTSAVAVMLFAACGGSTEQGREEAAARQFRQRLAQNRTDLIYQDASASLRSTLSEAQFRKLLLQSQVLGIAEQTDRAHYTRTAVNGGDVVLTFYNTKFTKGSCAESFSWKNEGDDLKLAAYSCAPNMQVTCNSGAACETSRVPLPGFAG
jgi:hypothetical protein